MSSLFIGRFQPFHIGHLDAIQQALAQTSGTLFIGIGSSNENYLPQNPFTTGERIQMIKAALDENKISTDRYMIIPIPNINNFELWPSHIEQYLPPFEKLFTCSNIVAELFENTNKKRKNPYTIVKIKKNHRICSTDIRKAIINNKKWESMVPKSVQKLLKTWDAPNRLKSIQENPK